MNLRRVRTPRTLKGKTRGTVKKKLASETKVGGQKVAASDADPRYLIESEKSGNEAAHKPESLSKVQARFKEERWPTTTSSK